MLLFFAIAGVGIILTIFLYFTGEKKTPEIPQELVFPLFTIFKIGVSSILFLYVFRMIMMWFTGIISEAYIVTFVGFLCALVPLVIIDVLRIYHRKKLGG